MLHQHTWKITFLDQSSLVFNQSTCTLILQEIDVLNKKAIIISVPFPQLRAFQVIQVIVAFYVLDL